MKHRKVHLVLPFILLPVLLACQKDESMDRSEGREQDAGAEAESFLEASPYSAMTLHVLYMKGYKPKSRALDSLGRFLERHLKKPDGIDIETQRVSSGGKSSYSIEDIDQRIEEHRYYPLASERVHVYSLVVDGSYEEDGSGASTLGVAYRPHRTGIFGASVHEYSDEATEPERWKLEGTVLAHELGHLLGLVDNGSPMVNDHRDSGNGAHCDNSDCLMYHSTATSDVVGKLFGSEIPDLDGNCQADLESNGGK
jgi:hypothetical protein